MNENLQLVTTEKFGNVQTSIYEDENNEMYMTIAQLAECLGYANGRKGIDNLIGRHKYLQLQDFSDTLRLRGTDGKAYKTRVFNEDGIYEVTFLSDTPKAFEFRCWVRQILKSLRKGEYRIEKNGAIFSQELFEIAIQKYLPCVNTKNLNIWKYQTVKPLITALSNKLNVDTRTVYDLIYDNMTSRYGFSRSFAITQFCDKYRLVEASVIDAIADDYTLQSWFVQSVNDIMDYTNKTNSQISEISIVSPKTFTFFDNISDIVMEIGNINGDKSANYAHTYGKIYSQMTTKQGWKNLKTRYKCMTNKEVIEMNRPLKQKFIKVANDMLI